MRLTALATTVALAATCTAGLTGPGNASTTRPAAATSLQSAVLSGPPLAGPDAVRRQLGLGNDQQLVVQDVMRDSDGSEHTRYDRRYRDLPVIAGDLVVHRGADGRITHVDWAGGRSLEGLTDVTPDVSRRMVTSDRRGSLPAGFAAPGDVTVVSPQLMVDNRGPRPRLVWSVETTAFDDGAVGRARVDVVSASTGEHIRGWSQTYGAEAEGTGRTYYSGAVPLSTTETTEGFALRDQSRGGSSTWRVTSAGGEVIGRDADNVWGDGTLASQQTLMAEVHHGVQATWDFYREELGRRGFADNGNGVRAYVDRDRHRNAFWYDGCRCLVVVDGAEGRPFSEVAVIAHEITHGVTWKTANLDYFGESGGLNESTSDIFGTMAEWHVANPVDRGDYWLGEGSEKGRRIPFVRRLDRPEADGRSVGCWRQGVGRMNVHFSSGIGNHFFYLLAEGTGAKRFAGLPHNGRSCTGADFEGIGRERAAAIWYRALTRYMVSTTGYREARDATIRAARDLYGEHSPACRAVTRTWSSVRVPQLDWQCSGKLAYGPNAVRNPGFEQGRDGWDGTWGRHGLAIVKRPAWAWRGDRFALLGGSTRPAEAWLGQRLRVPATRTAKLRTWVHVQSSYYGREVHDTLRVEVTAGRRTVVLKRLTNLDADNTYQRMQLNLGRWRGERVQIRFHSVETRRDQTIWLLDGVSVTRR